MPREAYDPAFDLATANTAALIDAMLVRIASRPNPYLHSAEELTQAGFPGHTLPLPLVMVRRGYIDRAGINQPQLRFIWDEWNVRATYEAVRPAEVERLARLSRRANCAVTIGIAEWILARFEGMDADPDPAHFLEAAWAANVDERYASAWSRSIRPWTRTRRIGSSRRTMAAPWCRRKRSIPTMPSTRRAPTH